MAEAIAAVHADGLGNPSGAHQLARAARRRLDEARDEVASLLGRGTGDVVFTSGGTEADNLAVLGVVAASAVPGATAVCGATEHHAVLDPRAPRSPARSSASTPPGGSTSTSWPPSSPASASGSRSCR